MAQIIGITGYEGRLGSMLIGSDKGYVPLDCDITNPESIRIALDQVKPDVVINCAAFTDVDEAEMQVKDAFLINSIAVKHLREEFKGWLIHVSTDYVFRGLRGPYSERYDKEDEFPEGIYGQSKRMGELHAIQKDKETTIVRTTMLYGHPNIPDFVTAVIDNLKFGEPFEVTHSLAGSPTYIPHLIEGLDVLLTLKKNPNLINITGSDVLSRYEFALMIASVWGFDKRLIMPTRKVPGIAPRPRKAGLKCRYAKTLGIPIYSVLEGLESMKNERPEE